MFHKSKDIHLLARIIAVRDQRLIYTTPIVYLYNTLAATHESGSQERLEVSKEGGYINSLTTSKIGYQAKHYNAIAQGAGRAGPTIAVCEGL